MTHTVIQSFCDDSYWLFLGLKLMFTPAADVSWCLRNIFNADLHMKAEDGQTSTTTYSDWVPNAIEQVVQERKMVFCPRSFNRPVQMCSVEFTCFHFRFISVLNVHQEEILEQVLQILWKFDTSLLNSQRSLCARLRRSCLHLFFGIGADVQNVLWKQAFRIHCDITELADVTCIVGLFQERKMQT